MQNIQQQIVECVKVYYEHLLKLTNYLHVKPTNVFFTIVFRASLLPYLRLTTASMKRNIFNEHKEVVIVCEENGPVSMNYNALLTTPKANVRIKPIVLAMTTKLALICTNCGKIGHLVETCHNIKKEVLVVPISIVKST
jgi:hypothetical protein